MYSVRVDIVYTFLHIGFVKYYCAVKGWVTVTVS